MTLVPLFWQSAYLEIQSQTGFFSGITHSGHYEEGRDHHVFRTWACFDLTSNGLRSPCRATFGGYWSVAPTHFESDVEDCLLEMKSRYPSKTITFYLPPIDPVSEKVSSQLEILSRSGFEIDFVDSNFLISTQEWSLTDLSKGNRKKLRQWNEAGGHIGEVGLGSLPNVYEVIRLNRLSLGVKPSITLDDLTKLAVGLDSSYNFYIASIDGQTAAVAVTVEARSTSKYVFFWADVAEYRHLSPVVALCAHLIDVCNHEKKRFLDLGISTEDGLPNPGLIRFKRNLGASECPKFQLSAKS
jgi:hypothetical protein